MGAFSAQDLEIGLHSLGIYEGITVFLHSDLMTLGIPQGTKSRGEILTFYHLLFQKVIGDSGTLSVPAYFYEYARYGYPFDTKTSPPSKSLGAFSAYVCSLPHAIRSANPIQSIASIGFKAEKISGGDSLHGYGVTSPWHRLRKENGIMLFMGVDMRAMTFVHHIEQVVGVPHMYLKVFSIPVYRGGSLIAGNPISAVRYLNFEIEYDLKPFETLLFEKKVARQVQVGQGVISSLKFQDAYEIGVDCLKKNPYFFLKNPPKFTPGVIPNDGPAGRS